MILSIDHAINILYKMHQHTQSAKEQASLDMGISALMTIKDGNYQLHQDPPTPNKDAPPALDIKTLYEQLTMELQLFNRKQIAGNYTVEIFVQPSTPLCVYVYWTDKATIDRISFEIIKENK